MSEQGRTSKSPDEGKSKPSKGKHRETPRPSPSYGGGRSRAVSRDPITSPSSSPTLVFNSPELKRVASSASESSPERVLIEVESPCS